MNSSISSSFADRADDETFLRSDSRDVSALTKGGQEKLKVGFSDEQIECYPSSECQLASDVCR